MAETCLTLRSVDLARLQVIADAMTATLPPGLVIGLVGTLGAGKTRFTQALALALGIPPTDVTSPTFTLLHTYPTSVSPAVSRVQRLHHLDAYRLVDEDEFLEVGVEELLADQGAWTIVEWADRVVGVMPANTLWITFDFESSELRRLTFRSSAKVFPDPLRALDLGEDVGWDESAR